ncbi:MAG TPA: aquaporin [Fimbriimonadaceae bacterium]|nr:aquaporin [Fimbriimonadaceae bacterium]
MNLKALVAELIGTMLFVFVGIGSIAAADHANQPGLVVAALAHGIAIAVLASTFGAISGGHFNPAVTFAAWIGKKITLPNMIGYWIAQVLGAVIGAFMIRMAFLEVPMGNINDGVPGVVGTLQASQAYILEGVGTFFLVLVVYGTAIDRRAPKMGALFIGLTITAVILAIGPLTGAAINPARFLGPALVTNNMADMTMFLLAPMIGGGLAGALYAYFFADREPEMPVSELAP